MAYHITRRKALRLIGLGLASTLASCSLPPEVGPNPKQPLPDGPVLLPLGDGGVSVRAENPIERENARPGTTDWIIPIYPVDYRPLNREIEGYTSAASVNRGQNIDIFVSCKDPTFDIEVYRLGYYGGAGARLMRRFSNLPGKVQITPSPNATTGLIECNWEKAVTLTCAKPRDPYEWISGYYLIKLIASGGKQNYIPFVLRDDNPETNPDILMHWACNRDQAYNAWGGKSQYGQYGFSSQYGAWTIALPSPELTEQNRAHVVSFDRPYDRSWRTYFLFGEYPMVRFLEREGYNVAYCSNTDTHARPSLLKKSKVFMSVGHDEYWTKEMRDNVEDAYADNVHLAFFSANTCYWQVRYAANASGVANRRVICYKDAALDPVKNNTATVRFRDPPVNRPEISMMGVMYGWDVGNQAFFNDRKFPNLIVTKDDHWVFQNADLSNGYAFWGLVGYECDSIFSGFTVPNRTELCRSPVTGNSPGGPGNGFASAVIIEPSGKPIIFSSGTHHFQFALDDRRWEDIPERDDWAFLNRAWNGRDYKDYRAIRMTHNLLNGMIGNTQGNPPSSLIANPGFELANGNKLLDWVTYGAGYTIDAAGGRSGNALKLSNLSNGQNCGAGQQIQLNQSTPKPLKISGWSRAQGISGQPSFRYSIHCDIAYTDGSYLPSQTLNFDSGTHGWQYLEGSIQPQKPILWVRVYCLLRPPTLGTVWFDDLSLSEV